MKILIKSAFLLLGLLVPAHVEAHDFEVDGIYYNVENGSAVSVTYKGRYYEDAKSYSGDVVIPAAVTHNDTTYTVSVIVLKMY